MKLNNNDDSHNSGLNLLIYNMLLDIESHPAWVCGLKHVKQFNFLSNSGSHPAWVCGLKHQLAEGLRGSTTSHPAWVCGLKRSSGHTIAVQYPVTPCVGVWIETCSFFCTR